ncbi:MAG: c-type cytochrome [Deltaproteobacteria bacterium]|nr:c-type cytochrome [Deltaproteobacteria bacterium]
MLAAGVFVVVALVAQPGPPRPSQGLALAQQFECARCHALPDSGGQPLLADSKRCANCHARASAGTEPGPRELRQRWKTSVVHYVDVPVISGLARHLRRDWVARFLQAPHDVRPALEETMPRLRISPDDADEIAGWLSTGAAGADDDDIVAWPPGVSIAAGREFFVERGCIACHAFQGSGVGGGVGIPSAPDLRHTRQRLSTTTLLKWLADPQAMAPATVMPKPALDAGERHSVARFLLEQPLVDVDAAVPARLPVLARAVRWPEVEPLFAPCAHCHDDAVIARGDGGPGNSGGMGFAPARLDLSGYGAVLRSRSKGAPITSGLLVKALWLRHEEAAAEARGVVVVDVAGPRGMPLGLPPLAPADIQLVESWIAQGMPR